MPTQYNNREKEIKKNGNGSSQLIRSAHRGECGDMATHNHHHHQHQTVLLHGRQGTTTVGAAMHVRYVVVGACMRAAWPAMCLLWVAWHAPLMYAARQPHATTSPCYSAALVLLRLLLLQLDGGAMRRRDHAELVHYARHVGLQLGGAWDADVLYGRHGLRWGRGGGGQMSKAVYEC